MTDTAAGGATEAVNDLRADLIHFAKVQHETNHDQYTWLACDRGVCPGVRRALRRFDAARAAPAPQGD